ncbi:trophoblast glycoprotein-like [Rhinatrema bivittatum]|uniref:trophoblast glycoprotein-like n=1 Tax=Rhinatrema bivittatum TaxID=194408 RepID=UPI001129B574|nr:trophoblast glycoprotein-like [Rhinatrema bivittatum]
MQPGRRPPLLAPGLLLLVALRPAGGAHPCPPRCLCLDETGLVECGDLPEIPGHLPPWTRNLTVVGGHLPLLRASAFGGQAGGNSSSPWATLAHLVLTDDRIRALEARAFRHLPALATLDLSGNALVAIARDAFLGCPALRSLKLNGALRRRGASGQPQLLATLALPGGLQELELAGNELETLPASLLEPLPDLRALDLRDNELTTLPEAALATLARRGRPRLRLHPNPFLCDCRLRPLLAWLANASEQQVADAESLRCAAPPARNGSLLLQLPAPGPEECGPQDLQTASYVFFGIVLALIGVTFLAVLYLNRRGIKRWLNNLREACRDQMEGYHYRYEQDAEPRRAPSVGEV